MATTRDQVIRMQKATLRSLKRKINEHVGSPPAELARYRADYHRATAQYRSISTRAELMKSVARSDIVLCGDFHTLEQAQRIHVRLLRDQLSRGRPIILGVEVIPASEQEALTAFLDGRLDETAFLKAIEYEKIWGFPWDHYRPLFEFASSHAIPVFGLNTTAAPGKPPPSLASRDGAVARRVAALTRAHPDKLLFVTFGDMHLAANHLPAKLKRALGTERRKVMVIFQNSESLYWQLAEEGLADQVDVVEVADDVYCISGVPPWVKLQSYLDWLENTDRQLMLGESYHESKKASCEEELYSIACEVAAFLGLSKDRLDDFDFYTIDDCTQLQSWYPDLPSLVHHQNCLYFPDRKLIFLSIIDINHAAEAAAELVHHVSSGYQGTAASPRDAFYQRVMRRALAYFGSMVLNHKRKCWYFRDHHLFVETTKGRRLDDEERDRRFVSRMVLRHQEAEDDYIWGLRRRLHLPALYRADERLGGAISRAIGYIQGDKFYRGLFQQVVTGKDMRQLFRSPLEAAGEAFQTYIHWRTVLKQVFKMFTSKDQFF